jgi:hypothetical protein
MDGHSREHVGNSDQAQTNAGGWFRTPQVFQSNDPNQSFMIHNWQPTDFVINHQLEGIPQESAGMDSNRLWSHPIAN